MGTVSQDTDGPSEVPRMVASDIQRWMFEIDGHPGSLVLLDRTRLTGPLLALLGCAVIPRGGIRL